MTGIGWNVQFWWCDYKATSPSLRWQLTGHDCIGLNSDSYFLSPDWLVLSDMFLGSASLAVKLSNMLWSPSTDWSTFVNPDGKCVTAATRLVGMAVSFVTLSYREWGATPNGFTQPKFDWQLMIQEQCKEKWKALYLTPDHLDHQLHNNVWTVYAHDQWYWIVWAPSCHPPHNTE